jgi:hypothetical protein
MFARTSRRIVVILGLLALLALQRLHTASAAPPQCTARQQVTFLNSGDAATENGIVSVVCATSRVRGLAPKAPVNVRLLDPTSLRGTITQLSEAEIAAQSLTGATETLQLLGALGPKQDLATIGRSQYNVNTAADYDPRSKTLYIRSSKTALTPLDRAVIAHEYTRALQDQYFSLTALLTDSGGATNHNSDALLAREAVVEGDAFTTMLNYAATFSRQDQVLFNQELQRPGPAETDFAHDRIGFPAMQGTTFVKAIMVAAAKGKTGSAATTASLLAVNQALANPPSTTKQVLNPQLYLQHTPPATSMKSPIVSLGSSWQELGSDVLGSFAISDLFSPHNATSTVQHAAVQAAISWQNDRWVVYQHDAASIMVWRAHFDSVAGAQAFQRILVAYTAGRFHTTLGATAALDWHTTGFAISVRRHDVDVAMAIGSSSDLLSTCMKSVTQLGF